MRTRHLSEHQLLVFKVTVFLLALLPLADLVWGIVNSRLGPDPGEAVTRSLGLATFQLLLATLAMTPLQRLTGLVAWVRVRRMLGLFALFYGIIHLLAYLQFIAGWGDLVNEVVERPFITMGSAALVMMVPLGLTSTKGMMRRLGKRWKQLHKLTYVIALMGWIHFIWQARSDIGEMVAYGAVLLLLLGFRTIRPVWHYLKPSANRK
jgi:sulfoxide reductase heme-binding subunit YedZ